MQFSPKKLYKIFLQNFGSQNWWPVTDKGKNFPTYKKRKELTEKQRLEICIGSILTQNTNWKNVEKAIVSLNNAGMIDAKKISSAKHGTIAKFIRSSGYFNQKAKKLKIFCKHVLNNYNGKLSKFFEKTLEELREELLSIHGIGQETADSIILYAAQKPSFVADAYTKRFLERYYGKTKKSYVKVKDFFEQNLPKKSETSSEMHALLVEFSKQYCRKKPLCGKCFLRQSCVYYSFK